MTDPTPAEALKAEERPYPDLLSDEEGQALLTRAEELWADLQADNLGGFSGINRPFWIEFAFKSVIEAFGRRDVGLSWSKNDLDAATPPPPDAGEVRKAPQWADDSDPIGDLAIKLAARATAIEEEEGRGEWTWREIAECAVEALAPPAAAIRKLP